MRQIIADIASSAQRSMSAWHKHEQIICKEPLVKVALSYTASRYQRYRKFRAFPEYKSSDHMKLGAITQALNFSSDVSNISSLDKSARALQGNQSSRLASKIQTATLLDKPKALFYSILGDSSMSSLAKAENIKNLVAKVGNQLGAAALKLFVQAVFNIPTLVSKFGLPVIGVVVDILRNPSPVAMATLSDVASAMLTERQHWTEIDLKRYASLTADIYNPSEFKIGNCGPISHANVFNAMTDPSGRIFRNIPPDTENRIRFGTLTKNLGLMDSPAISRRSIESSSSGYLKLLEAFSQHTNNGKIVQLSFQGSPPIVKNNTSSPAPAPKPGEVGIPHFSHPTNHAINVLQVKTNTGGKQLAILDSQTGVTVVGNKAVENYLRNVTGPIVQFLYRYQP